MPPSDVHRCNKLPAPLRSGIEKSTHVTHSQQLSVRALTVMKSWSAPVCAKAVSKNCSILVLSSK